MGPWPRRMPSRAIRPTTGSGRPGAHMVVPPLRPRSIPFGSEKVGNFPKLPDVYLSIRMSSVPFLGGPQLAAALGSPVRVRAASLVSGRSRPGVPEDRHGAVSITRTLPLTATHDPVIYATILDIQSRQGTFDSPTRWTYWRVQSAVTLRHVPYVLEGRDVPQ
ncbi:hypothetical protein BQ8420_25835 [Nocardiopsis sp. JB363]|nr:hypothetical protein BQ8420_25835 [Nocardiopsis sp. JB363]